MKVPTAELAGVSASSAVKSENSEILWSCHNVRKIIGVIIRIGSLSRPMTRGKMKKSKESITSILIGDTLGEVVSKLPSYVEAVDAKFIVIFVPGDNIEISYSSNMTKFEVEGVLHRAIYEFE